MEHRRYFGFRPPRPIGDSTILVPQLENYSLFATPFIDLKKKIGKSNEVVQDAESKSGEISQTRQTRAKGKKNLEQSQKLSEETSQDDDSFGIVLNLATVKPEQFAISFGEGNEIEVKVDQDMFEPEYGNVPFSRNCTYKYELPDNVDKKNLVALWTSDDYLIILPKDQLRDDLLSKSLESPEETSEDSSKTATSKEPKKPEKPPKKKTSDPAADESIGKEVKKVLVVNSVIPVHPVTRMLRPGMDIFMLRKYMVDLESYISMARKFVENASFLLHNSKSAERCIRFLAQLRTDDLYEEPNLKNNKKRKMKTSQPSADDGYASTEVKSKAKR